MTTKNTTFTHTLLANLLERITLYEQASVTFVEVKGDNIQQKVVDISGWNKTRNIEFKFRVFPDQHTEVWVGTLDRKQQRWQIIGYTTVQSLIDRIERYPGFLEMIQRSGQLPEI